MELNLKPRTLAMIDAFIASGRFKNTDEVFSAALDVLDYRDQEFQADDVHSLAAETPSNLGK